MTRSKWHRKIYDVQTGQETFIEFTIEEIAQAEADQAAFLAEIENLKAKREAEQAAKDAAKQAVLDKLGLSIDEVAALLG